MSVPVTIARSWLGTPYLHQASRKGIGCDCLGLIRGIWREMRGREPEEIPAYTADWSEPQGDERLWRAAQRHFVSCDERPMQEGDILLFRMRAGAVAKHLGVLSQAGQYPHFIHAYTGHGVTESPLSGPWAAKIVARFSF